MKRALAALILVLALAVPSLARIQVHSYSDPVKMRSVDVVSGEVLVIFREGRSASSFNVLEVSPKLNVRRIAVPRDRTLEQFIAELNADPGVEYAGPNHVVRAFATIPNDPHYPQQWGLPLVKAPEGWDMTKGDASLVVAVIDSGADLTHPDLVNKLVPGWNFWNNNDNPIDENGHGTHVAGIIAAETDNAIGIAGVSWRSKIMPLRIMDQYGDSDELKLSNAMIYAADNGAKILNMSLGGSSAGVPMINAVNYAHGKGCLLVAASGNGIGGIAVPHVAYPAALPKVVAVGAVDSGKTITAYSNYGPEIDLCAPGGTAGYGVYSTIPTNSYGNKYGTSMATPFVSGLAALIFARYPAITAAQVRNIMTTEAEDLGPAGKDNHYGWGLIDVIASLGDPYAPSVQVLAPSGGETVMKNGTLTINYRATDIGSGLAENPISFYYSTDNGGTYTLIAGSQPHTGSYPWLVPHADTTSARIKVTATDLAGNVGSAESNPFTIMPLEQGIYSFPQPARTGSSITFLGLSGGEVIRIYDAAGDLVRGINNTSSANLVWDARNNSGDQCVEGVYFYVITYGTSVIKTGRLVIAR